MKITIRYTRKGETTEVSTSLLTVVAWERKFKRKASDMGNGMGIGLGMQTASNLVAAIDVFELSEVDKAPSPTMVINPRYPANLPSGFRYSTSASFRPWLSQAVHVLTR